MKCEESVVSVHQSKFVMQSLRNSFSFPILLEFFAPFPCLYSVLLLSVKPFDLSATKFKLSPYLHLFYAFVAVHFIRYHTHLFTLNCTARITKQIRFIHSMFSLHHFHKANVSLSLSTNSTEILILIHCSIFLSSIFRQHDIINN